MDKMRKIGHLKSFIKRMKKNDPGFYNWNRKVLGQMMPELHSWFDEFAFKKININGENYDYTQEETKIRHREQRHHEEGVQEITEILTEEYGDKYKSLIEQEAYCHVYADMGRIPKKREYEDEYFWQKWEGNYGLK
jgi:hypothetical protein